MELTFEMPAYYVTYPLSCIHAGTQAGRRDFCVTDFQHIELQNLLMLKQYGISVFFVYRQQNIQGIQIMESVEIHHLSEENQ